MGSPWNRPRSITLNSRTMTATERHVMANAQYWRQQVARLHRAASHRQRLPEERVPLRLRPRNDRTSAHRLRPAYDPIGIANGMALRPTRRDRAAHGEYLASLP